LATLATGPSCSACPECSTPGPQRIKTIAVLGLLHFLWEISWTNTDASRDADLAHSLHWSMHQERAYATSPDLDNDKKIHQYHTRSNHCFSKSFRLFGLTEVLGEWYSWRHSLINYPDEELTIATIATLPSTLHVSRVNRELANVDMTID
jgi:hypothetical protein